MTDVTVKSRRIGSIELTPGATPSQVWIFLVVVTITSVMFGFVSVVQPYLFSEVLHIPTSEQGRLTGMLQMVQYGAVALFILPAGALADRIGRKAVLIMAMIGFIATLLILPFCAVVIALAATRFMLGVASTGHTTGGATMMVDFPTNASRGKFLGLMLVVQASAGAFFSGYLMTHIPGWLIAGGMDKMLALRISLGGLAALGVIGVVIAVFLFRAPPRLVTPTTGPSGLRGLLASSRAVLKLARTDPTFGLVVLVAFVVRSDYYVTASFLSVWVMAAARDAGATPTEALKTVGTLQVILQLSLALSPFAFGFLADRMNRMVLLICALAFAAVMFACTALIHDVHGFPLMALVALIGLAETAQTVGSQSVFGERAPPELRGSAMGFFVLMGTISVIVCSYVSGILFDRIGYTAPFLFLGVLNVLFAGAAAILMLARRKAKTA